VKYPWCHKCKKLEPIFLHIAKEFKARAKKEPAFGDVTFGVLDPREERALGRRFGAGLAPRCGVCEVKVFTEVGEEAEFIKGKEHTEHTDDLEEAIPLYMPPNLDVFESLDDAALETMKHSNVTCVGGFASPSSDKFRLFKNVSRILRSQLKFAVVFGEERAVEMWHPNSQTPYRYEGSFGRDALLAWVRTRSLPLLQVYSWKVRARYDDLKLPVAKVFIDEQGPPLVNDHARSIIKRLAADLLGKVAFVEMTRATSSYEMHDFMLDLPEEYPAFGIQTNNSAEAHKYGFPIAEEDAESVEVFWGNEEPALQKLQAFLKDALDGTLPGAHDSAVPQTDWVPGQVRYLCWRDYTEITSPARPLLLELWNHFRIDTDDRKKSAQFLAELLSPYADTVTVARYDTGRNYFLKEHFKKRTAKESESEWYWITRNESAEAKGAPILRKLMNPKVDATPRGVLDFVKKRSDLPLHIDELMRQYDRKMKVYKRFKSFSKLNELGHDENGKFPKGFNVLVQVTEILSDEKAADGTELRTAVVGDATGIMAMRFEGPDEMLLAETGKTIEVRNARIILVKGLIRIVVGKWGMIAEHDGEADVVPHLDGDFTSHVFTDSKGKPRDEL